MCAPTRMCVHAHACHGTCVQVTRQLSGGSWFSPFTMGLRMELRSSDGKGAPQLNHLAGPDSFQDPEKRYWNSQLPEELLPLRGMPQSVFLSRHRADSGMVSRSGHSKPAPQCLQDRCVSLVRKQRQVPLDTSQGQYSKISTNLFQCALPENTFSQTTFSAWLTVSSLTLDRGRKSIKPLADSPARHLFFSLQGGDW